MIQRKLVRQFPVFFTYTVYEALQAGTLFVLDHSSAVSPVRYWQVFWALEIPGIVLRFAIIYEIYSEVLRSYPTLAKLMRLVFDWGGAILALAAVLISARAPDAGIPLLSRVHVVAQGVGFVQAGLMLLLFLLAAYFRLSWNSFVYGVALGLAVFATVDLATAAIEVSTGPAYGSWALDFVTLATYHCCTLIWLYYVLVPQTERRPFKGVPDHNLEEWNATLQRLLTP